MTTNEGSNPTLNIHSDFEDLDVGDFENQPVDIRSTRCHSAWSSGYSDSEEDMHVQGRGNPKPANGDNESSSSEDNEEDYMPPAKRQSDMHAPMSFTERRAAEELILDRITNHLAGDKLPGILAIIQVNNGDNRKGSVEIDLSSLTPRRLRSVLAYVEACLEEQQGGPKVDVNAFIVQDANGDKSTAAVTHNEPVSSKKSRRKSVQGDYVAPARKRATKQPTKRRKKKKTSLIDLLPSVKPVSEQEITETLDPATGDEEDSALPEQTNTPKDEPTPVEHSGPISLAEFISASKTSIDIKPTPKPIRQKTAKKPKARSFSAKMVQTKESIAGSRPKRLAALQSMTVVEDLLGNSSDEDQEEEDEQILWLQSEAKHQPVLSLETILTRNKEEEDDEEDIDVLD
ncbi:hypothetical protein Unana1_02750 [Umbelopsis nana]